MSRRSFYLQLTIVTGILALALFLLHRIEALQPYAGFSITSLAFFILISLVMYWIGLPAAQDKDRNAFTRLVLIFVFAKMALAVGLIIGYQELVQPIKKIALLPFFLIYLVFTVFETYFMGRLGRMESKP